MNTRLIVISLITAGLSAPALAQKSAGDHAKHHEAAKTEAAMADGEVRKIDKAAKKITLKHGRIPSIDMDPMTMMFSVQDAAMLDKLKVGDKVKFQADLVGGAITVTRIEPAK